MLYLLQLILYNDVIISQFFSIVKFKMKIYAIICEFNPFHNGHAYLIEQAKKFSGADAVLCIMSGNFTQRGDMCILDKYVRARHAVLSGADCVIQLPSPFAVAPAEIFAKGAIKILSSIPDVSALVFGCESGNAESFKNAAKLLNEEPETFKTVLNEKLTLGESYIKSYAAAFEACGGDKNSVSNPNNVLGLEYAKAILKAKADIEILPVKRIGADYNDSELKDNYSSASAIRKNLDCSEIRKNIPDFVFRDLKKAAETEGYEFFLRACLFKSDANDLKRIYGCGEGLENKLKSLENERLEDIIANATSKRYPSSRIRRILCANALGLYSDDCDEFLNGDLYIKPLAVKDTVKSKILSALSASRFPVVTGTNKDALSGTAKKCFEKDFYEYSVYNHINRKTDKDYMIII